MPLLDIRNLNIEIITSKGTVTMVDCFNLTVTEGEFKGLVGESGSGKSLIAMAICGLIKENWRISADRFRLNNVDLLKLTARKRRKLVGQTVSMIFQEPESGLDPSMHIGKQLIQVIPLRNDKEKWWKIISSRKRKAVELLHRVGIKNHQAIMGSYPHELTSGECQKVMIAIALANQPRLLIADEPTTAMDPTTQAQIFRLLMKMNLNHNTSILLLSHDLQLVSQLSEQVNIIYCGQIMEIGDVDELMHSPHHPYTESLIKLLPSYNQTLSFKSHLNTLPGTVPSVDNLPIGCRLGPRCPYAQTKCIEKPRLSKVKGRYFACHFPLHLEDT